jgi:hypothetical protein
MQKQHVERRRPRLRVFDIKIFDFSGFFDPSQIQLPAAIERGFPRIG